jgi:hypothetical protein
LKDHYVKEDANGSIFRKNIGRVFLNKVADPYKKIWELDTSKATVKQTYRTLIDENKEADLEQRISNYLRDNITFLCFPVGEEVDRLRLEEGIISTLNRAQDFRSDNEWLGYCSPVSEIVASGLWNRQGLDGQPLKKDELEQVKWLARFGISSYRETSGARVRNTRASKPIQVHSSSSGAGKKTADDVRKYIEKQFQEAKLCGETYIDLVSGQVHKQLGMKNAMPQVCRIMWEKKKAEDKVLSTTPSGKSSTIRIRYYLNL